MKRALNSASNLLRRKLCSGSANAEAGLPNVDSPFSTEGTLLHWHDANPAEDRSRLTPRQREVLERNQSSRERFLAIQLEKLGITEQPRIIVEREFLLCDENMSPVEPEFPAHPDIIYYYPQSKVGFIFDSKFGRNEVTPADTNMQLRVYAVVFADEFECDKIFVAISQPWLAPPLDFHAAQYCGADIPHFRNEILSIIESTRNPDAKRSPSTEACTYCKAHLNGACQESQKIVHELAIKAANGMPIETLERIWPEAKRARAVIDQIEDRLKRIAKEHPDALSTLRLVPTGDIRKVTDTDKAVETLKGMGLSMEEIMSCCDISLPALEELFATRKSGMKLSEAEQTVEVALGSLISRTPKESKLAKK